MSQPRIHLKLHSLEIGDDSPVRVMGVLNVSRESFYRDSFVEPRDVAQSAAGMLAAGADALDIGARSTAPKSPVISVEEEQRRLAESLEVLFGEADVGQTPVSVDTQFRSVAELAFSIFEKHDKSRSFVLNDVSCLCADEQLAAWIAEIDRPVILMAAHARPGDSLGISQTIEDLQRGIGMLERNGMNVRTRVVIDPAIGRWIPEKSARYDLAVVDRLESFRQFGLPVLVGISRKSFIGDILKERDARERLYGTLSATAVAVYNGAHIVRTHDVTKETTDVIRVAAALRRSTSPSGRLPGGADLGQNPDEQE